MVHIMAYVLYDEYGNEIGVSELSLAQKIISDGANPFVRMERIIGYDDIIVKTYEEFCKVFY